MRDFDSDQELLTGVLTDVVRDYGGEDVLARHERTVDLARAARGGADTDGELARVVGALDTGEATELVRSLTSWFALHNLTEDSERIRRVRARERREMPAPREGSLHAAVAQLRERGAGPDDIAALLRDSELRLVLTAHPTEARRRTVVEKLARVFTVLRELDERTAAPGDLPRARERLLATVQELWGSDEIRAVSPTVLDEVRGGLVFFVTTLADTVPVMYRDLEAALRTVYPGETIEVPRVLSFGSWMGGDRDGNPNVTPAVTAQTLDVMREQCLRFLETRVELLAGRLSLSERAVGHPSELDGILAEGEARFGALAAERRRTNPEEPYRRALSLMTARVRATRRGDDTGYARSAELLADLRTVERCLVDGGGRFTAAGDLRDVIRQVETFGFHFARLDVREHAKRHRGALDEILGTLGVCDGYARRDVTERADVLCREIADRRPLIPTDTSHFDEATAQVVETFRTLRELRDGPHADAIETYVISGTETAADMLEVLLLMKEAALTRAGGEDATLRIVPLFEAGATLDAAAQTLDTALGRPEYRAALRAVGDEQEVMVGYSDSNKDVGYTASTWATYRAQMQIAETLRAHGATWTFFHGRGGAVGRGGGPTRAAIAALPPGSVDGRMKLTEQGEVLATKYATHAIAHRELELSLGAVLLSVRERDRLGSARARYQDVVAEMAAQSTSRYRALVHDDPDFAAFFKAVTPVDDISQLQLGSRPARRSPGGGIDDLRAIPWVFSWTQSRIVLPAWFGLGSGLRAARERHGPEVLREMHREWPFFQTLLANAEMACAKADLRIGRRYVELFDDIEARERIWSQIRDEFALTVEELLAVTASERLLDRDPVLQASIDRRNPYVDALSFVQMELLRRSRNSDAAADPDEAQRRASLLVVNGIASGLRNTG